MMNINVGGRGDDELRHSFQTFDLYQYLPTFVASAPNVSSTISSHAIMLQIQYPVLLQSPFTVLFLDHSL